MANGNAPQDRGPLPDQEPTYILPAELVGYAGHGKDGILRIGSGEHIVEPPLTKSDRPGWWATNTVGVYVRRSSEDLSILEIHIARHDGLAQEELDEENAHGNYGGDE